MGDFVAKDHLARFVPNLVRDDINLAEITGTYAPDLIRGNGASRRSIPP